jgi:hypothetical protein
MVFEKTLIRDGRTRSFQIVWGPAGWEVTEPAGDQEARHQRHTDWHKIERTVARFTREIDELRREGWTES